VIYGLSGCDQKTHTQSSDDYLRSERKRILGDFDTHICIILLVDCHVLRKTVMFKKIKFAFLCLYKSVCRSLAVCLARTHSLCISLSIQVSLIASRCLALVVILNLLHTERKEKKLQTSSLVQTPVGQLKNP
jgi:hypothetical protein